MLIFPVRHHSPAAALQVAQLIRERRPKAVLVEGPLDATPLIPLLLDPETVPPVAIYAYGQGEQVRAAYWPFCAYSPEYAALKAGQAVGARLAFCDLPASVTLAWESEPLEEKEGPSYGDFRDALAEAAGFDQFESFWEAAFEQEAGTDYLAVMSDFGAKARALTPSDRDTAREQQMAAAARRLVDEGIASDEILLVCGAAHAEAVAAFVAVGAAAPGGLAETEVALALIPYSFPRLSEQSGYGAGNLAPWYYQQVWEQGGDFGAATRRTFALLARRLRRQGHVASLAQVIDATTLALTLAQLRGKRAPGADEAIEAAIACFGQGRPEPVADALRQIMIGEAVGLVTPRVGRTPLQTEFYATTRALGLPVIDAPKQLLLHMPSPAEARQSVFLHRLAVAAIPYAQELQSGLGGGGRAAAGGPLEQLSRVLEKWQLQWSPATDAHLIERTAYGSTLTEVCRRLLEEQLAKAPRIDAGTEVLLKMALTELTEPFPAAMQRCEALAADSGSFPALARATYHLDGLLSYGAARRLPSEQLTGLASRLFERAILHLGASAICADDAAREVESGLISLYELVRRQSPAAPEAEPFWTAITHLAAMAGAHPALRGLALVLLELDGRLAEGELTARLRFWLSSAAEAADNARLVAGLFSLHRGTLVRNRGLIRAVTEFLLELEVEQLIPLLPVLRRSLGDLSPAERSYLGETLAAVMGLQAAGAARLLQVSAAESELLQEHDAAVAATLADWRDRYGIA